MKLLILVEGCPAPPLLAGGFSMNVLSVGMLKEGSLGSGEGVTHTMG